ncbi:hypothetical protein ON010_g15244 [Phytophthora cinnamomi]|nr:hypothetical protein ON010_g15244 [Phytophthora cinnamomi]
MLWQQSDITINVQAADDGKTQQGGVVLASKHDPKTTETSQGFPRSTPVAPPSSPVAKILFLDGVRGAAVIFVVTQHSGYMHDIYMGAVGVDAFFVLSSFLLTMIFMKKSVKLLAEQASYRKWGWTLADYFSKRFFRVYPLFALVAVTLWLLPFEYKKRYYLVKSPEDFNLFQTLTFHPEHRHYLMWTLPLEISYYFILPAFVLAVVKMRRFWWMSFIPLYVWVIHEGLYNTRSNFYRQPLSQHLPTFVAGSMAAVIFVHREDSLRPFTRHFQKYIQNGAFMDMFRLQDNGLVLSGVDISQQLQFQKIAQLYTECSTRVLNLSFTSVQQYLMLVRLTAKAMEVAKDRGVVVLAATLMDFYVPVDPPAAAMEAADEAGGVEPAPSSTSSSSSSSSSSKHSKTRHIKKLAKKIAKKKSDEFSVNFVRVPNMIRKIRKDWCPKAFLITCKHQLDSGEDIEAAHADLEKWGVDVIAGNHHSREILLITEQEETIVTCPDDEDINDAFASAVADMHRSFRRKREILSRGKQLLLLSAKFSMLKENDVVNEDADGNKNVQFGLGVKIRADRRAPDAIAPVYELKHIFQNKSHCARAHVWEGIVEHPSSEPTRDVVVAFSPAGV